MNVFLLSFLQIAFCLSVERRDVKASSCIKIPQRFNFLRLFRKNSLRCPIKDETRSYFEKTVFKPDSPREFNLKTTWDELFRIFPLKLQTLVQKGFEKMEKLFGEILEQVIEKKEKIAVGRNLSIFDEGRAALIKEWPHLINHPPEDLTQAIACYSLNHQPFLEMIEPVERSAEKKRLGFGVRTNIDLLPYTLLLGYQGLDYNDDELPENVAIRVGMLNGTPKGTYTLLISGTKHVIEGAPGVALYHDKKITLIDKKTKIAFLGAFINGSKKPNVEWVVIEIDGQKIVMFFTNQAIKSGEELFVNYGDDYVIDDPIV